MPLGIERINARRRQPNDRITFIKCIEGPDKALAQDFLERIAAICNPIMKEHHISIMSLEEYEPNLEFVGRNFNAGEVIQLVLKAPYTGHWLPFKYVQMVMMHELAHCKQMNHSGAFWKVRNAYAGELKSLWVRGYTGEGMWSRGVTLYSGQYEKEGLDDGDVVPEHLCGGTYSSSRKRKRKIKNKLTYKEREARRIAKKFGANGIPLGADEMKVKLEMGKKTAAKPRVAGSARGRELRAAAALARFGTNPKEPDIKDEEDETDGETGSDDDSEADQDEAIDIDGKKMLDGNSRAMVKVCEDENDDDSNAQNEMSELRSFDISMKTSGPTSLNTIKPEDVVNDLPISKISPVANLRERAEMERVGSEKRVEKRMSQPQGEAIRDRSVSCPQCSMDNSPVALTCLVCANVLDRERVPSVWRCQSETCIGSRYVNAGDCGICGVCGARKGSNSNRII